VAVWCRSEGEENSEVVAARFAVGSGWETPVPIDSGGGAGWSPRIAADHEGNAIAVWLEGSDPDVSVLSNRYSAAAGRWEGTVVLAESLAHAGSPWIAVSPAGDAFAIWDQGTIAVDRYVKGDGWQGPVTFPSHFPTPRSSARIVTDRAGDAVAVWLEQTGSRNLLAARLVSGSGWSFPEQISGEGDAADADLAMDADGNVFVVWPQHDGRWWWAMANRFDSSRDAWENAVPLHARGMPGSSGWQVMSPRIAPGPGGTATAIFNMAYVEASGDHVWINRFEPASGWQGEERIDEAETSFFLAPAIAADATGGLMAVWVEDLEDSRSIWTRRHLPGAGWMEPVEVDREMPVLWDMPQVILESGGSGMLLWGTWEDIWSSRFESSGRRLTARGPGTPGS